MSSSTVPVLLVVFGLIAAGGMYVTFSSEESSEAVVTYYDSGTFTFSYSIDETSYSSLEMKVSIDGSNLVHPTIPFGSEESYSGQLIQYTVSGGDATITYISGLSVTVTGYSQFDFEISFDDSEVHSISIEIIVDGSLSTYSFTADLDPSVSESSGALLLTTTVFWAVFLSVVIFILFLVAALVFYARGGSR